MSEVNGQNLDTLIATVKGENAKKSKPRQKPVRMFNNKTTGAKGVLQLLLENGFNFGKVAVILGVSEARVKNAFATAVKTRNELLKAGKTGGLDILGVLRKAATAYDAKRGNTAQQDYLATMVASMEVATVGRTAMTEDSLLASFCLDFDDGTDESDSE